MCFDKRKRKILERVCGLRDRIGARSVRGMANPFSMNTETGGTARIRCGEPMESLYKRGEPSGNII